MTPKEKAQELVDKYSDITLNVESDDIVNQYTAKQCALIAVDEILDIDCKSMEEDDFNNHIEYWLEVKQEINKL